MSVYSGFSTRALESNYNSALWSLIEMMSKMLSSLIKVKEAYMSQALQEFQACHQQLMSIEEVKFSPPKFSMACAPLLQKISQMERIEAEKRQMLKEARKGKTQTLKYHRFQPSISRISEGEKSSPESSRHSRSNRSESGKRKVAQILRQRRQLQAKNNVSQYLQDRMLNSMYKNVSFRNISMQIHKKKRQEDILIMFKSDEIELTLLRTEGLQEDPAKLSCYITVDGRLFDVITPLSNTSEEVITGLPNHGTIRLVIKANKATEDFVGAVSFPLQDLPSEGFQWIPLFQAEDDHDLFEIPDEVHSPKLLILVNTENSRQRKSGKNQNRTQEVFQQEKIYAYDQEQSSFQSNLPQNSKNTRIFMNSSPEKQSEVFTSVIDRQYDSKMSEMSDSDIHAELESVIKESIRKEDKLNTDLEKAKLQLQRQISLTEELTEQSAEYKQRITDLEKVLEDQEENYKILAQNYEDYVKNAYQKEKALLDQLQESSQQRHQMSMEVERVQLEYQKLQSDLQATNEQIYVRESDKTVQTLKSELSSIKQQLSKSEKQRKETQMVLASLQQQWDSLTTSKHEITLTEYQERLHLQEEEIEDLKSELEDSQKQVDHYRMVFEELSNQVETEQEKLRRNSQIQIQELTLQLKDFSEENNNLHSTLTETESQLKKAQKEIKDLRGGPLQLSQREQKRYSQEIEHLTQSIRALEKQLQHELNDKSNLIANLEDAQNIISSLEQRVRELMDNSQMDSYMELSENTAPVLRRHRTPSYDSNIKEALQAVGYQHLFKRTSTGGYRYGSTQVSIEIRNGQLFCISEGEELEIGEFIQRNHQETSRSQYHQLVNTSEIENCDMSRHLQTEQLRSKYSPVRRLYCATVSSSNKVIRKQQTANRTPLRENLNTRRPQKSVERRLVPFKQDLIQFFKWREPRGQGLR